MVREYGSEHRSGAGKQHPIGCGCGGKLMVAPVQLARMSCTQSQRSGGAERDAGHEQSYHFVTDMWDPQAWVPPVSEGKAGQGSDSHVRGSMSTSGDVVPWVGAASWESLVGVAAVETRNVMVVVVQLPWTSCHVC